MWVNQCSTARSNTSACSIACSNQLIHTGTDYSVNLLNANGSRAFGLPQTWCTYGGASGNAGLPLQAAQDCECNGLLSPATQRAGITRPPAVGDGLSGVSSDRELNAFNSVPGSFVGGVPLTRAMNPWAMPEAST